MLFRQDSVSEGEAYLSTSFPFNCTANLSFVHMFINLTHIQSHNE
jgi:hypothetical protein